MGIGLGRGGAPPGIPKHGWNGATHIDFSDSEAPENKIPEFSLLAPVTQAFPLRSQMPQQFFDSAGEELVVCRTRVLVRR
jgi:hypothetical protein